MVKSELIQKITLQQNNLSYKDVEHGVNQLIECMTASLCRGERGEFRGFGSFEVRYHPPRKAHNPRTGETVATTGKYVVHFKPGKELRQRVNEGYGTPITGLSDKNKRQIDETA